MTAMKHKIYDWTFDKEAWGRAMKKAIYEVGLHTLAEAIGVTPSAVQTWRDARYTEGHEHPSMTNFIVVCNLLDLDPRTFFILEE